MKLTCLITGVMALLITGCSSSPTAGPVSQPAPPPAQPAAIAPAQPAATAPVATAPAPAVPGLDAVAGVKGNEGALAQVLAEPSAVTYRLNVQPGNVTRDKTEILDEILAQKQLPGQNDLVLVVFTGDGDIRFAMGALFTQKKVTVDEMLQLVRSHYLIESRKGDQAQGLANLIRAVNQRVGSN